MHVWDRGCGSNLQLVAHTQGQHGGVERSQVEGRVSSHGISRPLLCAALAWRGSVRAHLVAQQLTRAGDAGLACLPGVSHAGGTVIALRISRAAVYALSDNSGTPTPGFSLARRALTLIITTLAVAAEDVA